MKIAGWGNYPSFEANIVAPLTIDSLVKNIISKNLIARGNGRSYGDSSINLKNTIDMRNFKRILSFNNKTGVISCQSGVLLEEIINLFLPRGWFPYVTPGTKYVTIGGMVAADVHGKNHHKEKSFGKYIKWIELINASGKIIHCSPKKNKELFIKTIGGMGLTGVILNIAFKLRPVHSAWIKQNVISTKNLSETFQIFEKNLKSTYSVAWIDCLSTGSQLGKSIVFLGEHAKINDLPPSYKKNPFEVKMKKKIKIPFNFPSLMLNYFSIKIFNKIYYWKNIQNRSGLIDFDNFFYPLDSVLNWNKIYGRRGFIQYQCVIPLQYSYEGISELIKTISKKGTGSFLAVLKRLGKQESFFSFPMEGYTLALDFPVYNINLNLFDELDNITLKYKGRFYLAKDSRMKADTFKKSDSRVKEFYKYRLKRSLLNKFVSLQSSRLGI